MKGWATRRSGPALAAGNLTTGSQSCLKRRLPMLIRPLRTFDYTPTHRPMFSLPRVSSEREGQADVRRDHADGHVLPVRKARVHAQVTGPRAEEDTLRQTNGEPDPH